MAKPLFTINTNRTDCYSISCSSPSSDLSFDYRSSMSHKTSITKAILCSLSILKVLFFMSLYSILCANGKTSKGWKKLLPYLRTHLGQHRNMTSAPSHVIDITREGVCCLAFDVVVVVGGDGTLHGVVNGFFWEEKPVLVQAIWEPLLCHWCIDGIHRAQ
ncbi:hypothetical protein MKX03_030790 [Papaver bracteatum]|nr:hypothetical protein MKX03_030790 [Papaver bracteatum]